MYGRARRIPKQRELAVPRELEETIDALVLRGKGVSVHMLVGIVGLGGASELIHFAVGKLVMVGGRVAPGADHRRASPATSARA